MQNNSIGVKAAKELGKAVSDFKCDECDKKFDSEVKLRTHKMEHKVTSSPIPQIDGVSEFDVVFKPTYCKICEKSPEEIETSEDISYHVMNNHKTESVYEKYGKLWVDQRRYCIRRNSPFNQEI